mgnify:CR=1 FL=1
MTEDIARACGFESLAEFNALVSGADLSTQEKREAFKFWQRNDGSKTGLLRLQVVPA